MQRCMQMQHHAARKGRWGGDAAGRICNSSKLLLLPPRCRRCVVASPGHGVWCVPLFEKAGFTYRSYVDLCRCCVQSCLMGGAGCMLRRSRRVILLGSTQSSVTTISRRSRKSLKPNANTLRGPPLPEANSLLLWALSSDLMPDMRTNADAEGQAVLVGDLWASQGRTHERRLSEFSTPCMC